MEDLLKYAFEGGSFGTSLFLAYVLFKKFIIKEVVAPIESLQKENEEIKNSFQKLSDRVGEFVFKILGSHADLTDQITKDLNNMNKLFTEATQHTSQAALSSFDATKKVKDIREAAEKLGCVVKHLNEQNKKIETEITQLSSDMIFVKTKVRGKKEGED
jgi:methyl-accepting chemotaxis protein